MTLLEQWAWLARIQRTQGRKGEVFAQILTDFPEKFAERKRLWLIRDEAKGPANQNAKAGMDHPPRAVELANHWLHKGGIVLHFAGVDSISEAETLLGLGVAIPRAERAALGEDEAYIGDLIGCTLVNVFLAEAGGAPTVVGQIEDVDTTAGAAPLLVVRRSSSDSGRRDDEILVPFAKSYLRKFDLESRRLEMALPEGLLELNS